jgi:hypothetical protein
MKNPLEFYNQQKTALEEESSNFKKKLINLGIFRFAVFLTTCFLIYLTFGDYPDVFIIAFLGFSFFSFLVIKYINLKREKAIVDAKISINKTEIRVLNGDFFQLDAGQEFINPAHFYSNDIDLFNRGSFFQYTKRTTTFEGKFALAKIFTENKTNDILEKQKAINDLSVYLNCRQHFYALSNLVNVKN